MPRGHPFQKGQSGNPGGRPKGLAATIRERTRDGLDIVEFMQSVLCGKVKGAKVADRIAAGKFLAEHGFGKPVQQLDHTGKVTLEELVVGANEEEKPNA